MRGRLLVDVTWLFYLVLTQTLGGDIINLERGNRGLENFRHMQIHQLHKTQSEGTSSGSRSSSRMPVDGWISNEAG